MSHKSNPQQQTSLLQQKLEHIWYGGGSGAYFLKPLEWIYRALASLNKQSGLSKQVDHPVPVMVVGNISVGGTGKTPLVIYLAKLLEEAGYQPGIITRGYGGKSQLWPAEVKPDSNAGLFGDEPVLMAQRSGVPVVAGPNRNADIDTLLKHHTINIVISDDGLQHYKLKRDVEIAVIDGVRGLGNQQCLPAGPLREPASRLDQCDFVVVNEVFADAKYSMQLVSNNIHNLNSQLQQPLSEWKGRRVHAVTGIGNPERFFSMLDQLGLEVIKHSFPDHHAFSSCDLEFVDKMPVVMTEKDSVKCRSFAENNHWFIPVSASLSDGFDSELLAFIKHIGSEN